MKIDVVASKDVNSQGGGSNLPCIGLALMLSPKFKSQFWQRTQIQGCPPKVAHWKSLNFNVNKE